MLAGFGNESQCRKKLKKANIHCLILFNLCVGLSALASVKVLMMHVFEYFTVVFKSICMLATFFSF